MQQNVSLTVADYGHAAASLLSSIARTKFKLLLGMTVAKSNAFAGS